MKNDDVKLKIIFILAIFFGVLFFAKASSAATYYVDATGGNDTNSGISEATAWKTISKINSRSFSPGDFILFKRGETWRGQLSVSSSGSAGSPITFGAYGTGDKPKILGSLNLGSTGSWTQEGTNLWYAAAPIQIGNIIFNSESSLGAKVASKTDLDVQGEFWWDDPNDRVYLYSISNPGSHYTAIEAAQNIEASVIINSNKSYITIQDLDLRYMARHGIKLDGWSGNVDNIIIERNNISYIGGRYVSGTLRDGNGIDIYDRASNVYIRYNTIDNAWDSGITFEGSQESFTWSNIYTYYNIIKNCEHGLEIGAVKSSTTWSGIYYYNNVVYNSGGGWSHNVRLDPYGDGMVIWGLPSSMSNVKIENNLISSCIYNILKETSNWTGITLDYNLYYPDGSTKFGYNSWPMYQNAMNFTTWKTTTGKDAHSIATDPLLVNASGGDFHLQSASPTINAGINVGLTTDFDGTVVPQGSAPDIGAYEYVGAVPSDTTPPAPPSGVSVQ